MESNPILELKEKIRTLAKQQVIFKLQRKTVYLTVVRTMEPWGATVKHIDNRFRLRHMYLAYGLIRGKTVEQIENKSKAPYSYDARTVSKLVEKYSPEAICIST